MNSSAKLHDHTIKSLLSELISGRSVSLDDDGNTVQITDVAARAILNWFSEDRSRWIGNASEGAAEAVVVAAKKAPPVPPATVLTAKGSTPPTYRVKSVRAHHFAGLHRYANTNDVIYHMDWDALLLEAKNGSGKTSLLNALIWCLTGMILRSQQRPGDGDEKVEVWVDRKGANGENERIEAYRAPVCPNPPSEVVIAHVGKYVPFDTWVEVILVDSNGTEMPPIKRRIYCENGKKPIHEEPNTSVLNLPPMAYRAGTFMPGTLPYIQPGNETDIGKAIADMTGFSALADLSKRADSLAKYLNKQMTDKVNDSIMRAAQKRQQVLERLLERLNAHPELKPSTADGKVVSDTKQLAGVKVKDLHTHFSTLEADGFQAAQDLLGDKFNPADPAQCQSLASTIGGALAMTDDTEIAGLPSLQRFKVLNALTPEAIQKTEELINTLLDEYREVEELAKNPGHAAREQLYARVGDWIRLSEDVDTHLQSCAVCNSSLKEATDPATGKLVADHLKRHIDTPADHLQHTLNAWGKATETRLNNELAQALRSEIAQDLPNVPGMLMIAALTNELFARHPFNGVLSALGEQVAASCTQATADLPPFTEPAALDLPETFAATLPTLTIKLNRIQRALAFARWRAAHTNDWAAAIRKVVGPKEREDAEGDTSHLKGMLMTLNSIVVKAEPIGECLQDVKILSDLEGQKNTLLVQLKEYADTADSLKKLVGLGELIDHQMRALHQALHDKTETWKKLIYLPANSNPPKLAQTLVNKKGETEFAMETGGARTPSRHVSNASDMRATLFAFLLAFWQHLRETHGGLDVIAFDDVQELFDEGNQKRLCQGIVELARNKAQILLTSYDRAFNDRLAATMRPANDVAFQRHQILPLANNRDCIKIDLFQSELDKARQEYELNDNDQIKAATYVDKLRIYIEFRLQDCLPEWHPGDNSSDTLGDYLNAIRGHVGENRGPYADKSFHDLVNAPPYKDGSDALALMNKAHHGRAHEITYGEVKAIESEFIQVRKLADAAHRAFLVSILAQPMTPFASKTELLVAAPSPFTPPNIIADRYLDLAAATEVNVENAGDNEPFDNSFLEGKALYRLATHNFGFSAKRGDDVIIESEPSEVERDRLVIARHGDKIYAGRLIRDPSDKNRIAIASEAVDPTQRPPAHFFSAQDVELHKVCGILFRGTPGKELRDGAIGDAMPLGDWPTSLPIEIAYRVREESAEPLALNGQTILGGKPLSTKQLMQSTGKLVAIHTSDGRQVFKRVGNPALPGRSDVLMFESIGGKGDSLVLAIEEREGDAIPYVTSAHPILGILYTP